MELFCWMLFMIHLSHWGKARASDICPGKNYWVVVSKELERFRQSIPSELGVMTGVMALNHISSFENPAPPSPFIFNWVHLSFICLLWHSQAIWSCFRNNNRQNIHIQSSAVRGTALWTRVGLMAASLIYSLVETTKEAALSCNGPSGAEAEVIENVTDRSWSVRQQH